MALEDYLIGSSRPVDPNVLLATQGGLSRTDLAALLSPELGVGTGVVSEEALMRGIQQVYDQMLAEALAQQETLNRERVSEEAQIEAKYVTVRDPNEFLDTVGPVWGDVVAADPELAKAFAAIEQGATAQTQIDNLVTNYGADADWGSLQDALKRYETEKKIRDETRRKNDLTEQQNQARAAAEIAALPVAENVAAPLRSEAMAKFYKDLGLPMLGLLPDPSETYRADIESLQRDVDKETNQLRRRVESRFGDVDSGALERYASARELLPRGQQPAEFAGLGTTSVPDLMPVPKADVGAITGASSPSASYARQLELTRQLVPQMATSIERQAAASGRTPFRDALTQLLTYGTLEANR